MGFVVYLMCAALCFSQVLAEHDEGAPVPDKYVVPATPPSLAVEWERLLNDLWTQSTVARRHTPPFDANGTVGVQFGMSLISTLALDEDTGTAEFLFWDKYMWTDARLAWTPAAYGGLTSIRIPSTMLWMPDLRTFNTLIAREEDLKSNVYAVVTSDGSVMFIPPNSRKVACDVSRDAGVASTASCHIKIGSWTFDAQMLDVNFYMNEAKIDTNDYKKGPRVVNNQAVRNVKVYDCCPEQYVDLTFSFDLQLVEAPHEPEVEA